MSNETGTSEAVSLGSTQLTYHRRRPLPGSPGKPLSCFTHGSGAGSFGSGPSPLCPNMTLTRVDLYSLGHEPPVV